MARLNNEMKSSPKAKTINIAWGKDSDKKKKKKSSSETFIKNKMKNPWAR